MPDFDDEPTDGPKLELAIDPAELRAASRRGPQGAAPVPPGAFGLPSPVGFGTVRAGEADGMGPELAAALRPLLEGGHVEVRQRRERLEAVLGWETRNRYDVSGPVVRNFLEVSEEGEGLWHALSRNLNPFRRIAFEAVTASGIQALRVERPWTFWLTRAEVFGWDGQRLGTVEQRFTFFRRALEIRGADGALLAEIEGPFFRPWTFHLRHEGRELGAIHKRWGGVVREMFTDADAFTLTIAPTLTCRRTRQLLLAATILIDMMWFENRSSGRRRGGLFGLLAE